MTLLDLLLSQLAPYDCLGCGQEGRLLCSDCCTGLPAIVSRCYRCRKLTVNFATCRSCRSSSSLRRVYVSTVYEDMAKDAVWHLKFNGAQSVARLAAEHMTTLIKDSEVVIVPAVATTSRIRQRGYDQAKLLARELSRHTGLSISTALARSGQTRQVGAHRQQRLNQVRNAFRVKHPSLIQGKRILLVDDVITTGATLEAAAQALRRAGAGTVDAVAFAQP